MSRGIMAYCVDTNYFVYFCWMGRDESIDIINDGGELVQAKSPVIISASRSTDIPAFYADWFFHRLDKGYSVWINPFNNVRSYISYSKTRLIVFWSKNPRPLLKYLRRLDETGIHSYIQFTLNDYEKEDLKYFFPDFRKYEGMCKFNGCDHVHEPGCAVKAALEEDKIHKIRYQNYIEMYEEVKNKRRY